MELISILGYSALFCSVAGSTLVFLEDKYSQYAFLLWIFSNPIFMYLAIIQYSLVWELYFIAFSVMFYTALYGFILKRTLVQHAQKKRNISLILGKKLQGGSY